MKLTTVVISLLVAIAVLGCGNPSAEAPTATPIPPAPTVRAILESPLRSHTPPPDPSTLTSTPSPATPTITATPSRTPTPTPVATTVGPSATPTAWTPPPTPVPPRPVLFRGRVWQRAVMLAEELSPRESATDEEREAALFFADEFSNWGYDVEIQEFDAVQFSVLTSNVIGPEVRYVRWLDGGSLVFSLPLDAASLGGQGAVARGSLTFAGSVSHGDLAAADLAGKFALVERGELPLAEQVDAVARVGAEAAIVFNDIPGDEYFWERLFRSVSIPVIGITRNQGLRLFQVVESGVDVEVEVVTLAQDAQPSRNVIAELNNDLDGDRVVVIGAHLDTTPLTQGANDNGSGLAAVFIVAQELADDALPFDLRFVLFGAEETGLNGSYHYVRELTLADRSRIAAMINLDSIGTGNLSATGSESLLSMANEAARAIGIGVASSVAGASLGSDHVAFLAAGVPALFIYADNLPFINSPEDTLDHVHAPPMAGAVSVALGIIQHLAYDAQSSSRR